MKIVILSGSIRLGRQSHKIAYYLERKLQDRGMETDLIDLIDYPLPLLEERVNLHPNPPGGTVDLSRRLHEADAILLVSPEYHGSYSGVLKNAVDYFRTEFQKKPIGVVTATAGKLGGISAAGLMQQLVLHMGAYPLPLKLLVPEIQNQIDDNYQPLNEGIVKTVDRYLDEFLWFASAIVTAKKDSLKKDLV
jgi:NAD(P)H-dependent FMN reductase